MWFSAGQPVELTRLLSVNPSSRAFAVHRFGERRLGAGQRLGDHDTGVVARLDHDPANQVLHAHPLVDLHEHLRTAHPPGLAADDELVFEREMPGLQLVEDHVERHQLAQRRGVGGGRAVLVQQDRAGLQIEDVCLLRRRLHPPRSRRGEGESRGEDRAECDRPDRQAGRTHFRPSSMWGDRPETTVQQIGHGRSSVQPPMTPDPGRVSRCRDTRGLSQRAIRFTLGALEPERSVRR